jgi:predicted Co/Zn/Cd cation transporter (cation efflux family)
MIFKNISKIVKNHYISLAEETGFKPKPAGAILTVIFFLLPTVLGVVLGSAVTIWEGFISASAPVLSVLTGFSINTLVLLMRFDTKNSHQYDQSNVEKTKEFTLYSILIGVLIIIFLVFGFIIARMNLEGNEFVAISISSITYALIAHYFLTLLVITHRLYSFTKVMNE